MDMSSGDHRIDARGGGALFDIGIYCIAPFLLIAGRDPVGDGGDRHSQRARVSTSSMAGWIDWGERGFSSAFDVSFDAPAAQADGARRQATVVVDVPGRARARARPARASSSIQRRDGFVDDGRLRRGNAYARMVRALRGRWRPVRPTRSSANREPPPRVDPRRARTASRTLV